MKELFDSLWKVAPRLMSVITIFAFMLFVCLKISQFYLEIEDMKKRLVRVEEKVDTIIEYLLKQSNNQNDKPSGK